MSGQQGQQGHQGYDDGYGHQPGNNRDSYYQDDQQQYYDNGYDAQGAHGQQGGDGYYDESYVFLGLTIVPPNRTLTVDL